MINKVCEMLQRTKLILKDEAGASPVVVLAFIVASIVIIGFLVQILTGGLLEEWISQVWDGLWGWISDLVS